MKLTTQFATRLSPYSLVLLPLAYFYSGFDILTTLTHTANISHHRHPQLSQITTLSSTFTFF